MVVRLKRSFWNTLSLIFPYLRGLLVLLRVLHHEERDRYHLGWLQEGYTAEDLKKHLEQSGFGNHFIAWDEKGQLYSLRRLEGRYQYHLRIFSDGEVRGHYELTPEASIIGHFSEEFFEERREDFMSFLPEWVSNFSQPSIPSRKLVRR